MTENERIMEQIRGHIQGLKLVRLRIGGTEYDNDRTALMLRDHLSTEIDMLNVVLGTRDESVEEKWCRLLWALSELFSSYARVHSWYRWW